MGFPLVPLTSLVEVGENPDDAQDCDGDGNQGANEPGKCLTSVPPGANSQEREGQSTYDPSQCKGPQDGEQHPTDQIFDAQGHLYGGESIWKKAYMREC